MPEVEQARSITDLKSVLSDNTHRLIRPVHFRDIVETLRPGNGQIYLTSTATNVVGSSGQYYKLAGTTALSNTPPRNFIMPTAGRLQYTGTVPRFAVVHAHFSASVSAPNQLLRFQFYRSGVAMPETAHQRWFEPIADVGPVTMQAHMLLGQNQYVELWGSNQTTTVNFTVQTFTLSVVTYAY